MYKSLKRVLWLTLLFLMVMSPVMAQSSSSSEVLSTSSSEASASALSLQSTEAAETRQSVPAVTITYAAHVQNMGWLSPVGDGETAGTTGKGLRLEALKLSVTGLDSGSTLAASAHVQNKGWTDANKEGVIGSVGQGLRLEALTLSFTGAAAQNYDIWYRTHCEDYGWLDWASNGASAGTQGLATRIEAVEICILPKGSAAPGKTAQPFVNKETLLAQSVLHVQSHTKNIGWMTPVGAGEVAGTIGRGLQAEAFTIEAPVLENGSIEMNTFVMGLGFQGFVEQGEMSGTIGQNRAAQIVQFLLSGQAALNYSIYYQAHVSNIGWLDWARDGQYAGTGGTSPGRIEAIRVVLVPRNGAAPGPTACPYVEHGLEAAQPGVRTIKNLLATALEPVGKTLYVYGGGWNEPDTGAGEEAVTLGVSAQWERFFNEQDASYNYEQTRFQIHNGLDCSGYVGWALYNVMNTANGGEGLVFYADEMAKIFADRGWGSYTAMGRVSKWLPGDVVSLEDDGHVYMSLGTCADGSVVLAHASPPGVMISGTTSWSGGETQATQLAKTYMARYYPEYYARYSSKINRGTLYKTGSASMSWYDNVMADPDGMKNMTPNQVLKILYHE